MITILYNGINDKELTTLPVHSTFKASYPGICRKEGTPDNYCLHTYIISINLAKIVYSRNPLSTMM